MASSTANQVSIGGRKLTVKSKVDPDVVVVTAEHTLEELSQADAETRDTWRKQALRSGRHKFTCLNPQVKSETALAETSSLMTLIAEFQEQLKRFELDAVFDIQAISFASDGTLTHGGKEGDLFTNFSSLTTAQSLLLPIDSSRSGLTMLTPSSRLS